MRVAADYKSTLQLAYSSHLPKKKMALCTGHYLYAVVEREFLRCGDHVVRVGFSTDLAEQMKACPNGSLVLATARVRDGRDAERALLVEMQPKARSPRRAGTCVSGRARGISWWGSSCGRSGNPFFSPPGGRREGGARRRPRSARADSEPGCRARPRSGT